MNDLQNNSVFIDSEFNFVNFINGFINWAAPITDLYAVMPTQRAYTNWFMTGNYSYLEQEDAQIFERGLGSLLDTIGMTLFGSYGRIGGFLMQEFRGGIQGITLFNLQGHKT